MDRQTAAPAGNSLSSIRFDQSPSEQLLDRFTKREKSTEMALNRPDRHDPTRARTPFPENSRHARFLRPSREGT
jgi:hypothetical protein